MIASDACRSASYLKGVLAVLLCAGCLAGCATAGDRGDTATGAALRKNDCPPGAVLTAYENDKGNYLIRPGDELQIDFYLNNEFNRDIIVRPDGEVSLDVVGAVPAAGMTPEQFAEKLNQAYTRELRNPGVSVHLKSSPAWRVFVQGQVAHAGAFSLQPGMTALQAIAEAGGVTDGAGADSAVLIRRDACGTAQGIAVDLHAADSRGGKKVDDIALMPADVLVVPRSRIADLDLFVKQYIQGLLPIQPYLPIPL
ncbi:MAG TPA: polysaccharide biosynthesis/export family protein [Candidatus Binataceae bacterium]|nr:polysaccharide biosynthesis/export family protein [Candidatus Binataceae bacterium]